MKKIEMKVAGHIYPTLVCDSVTSCCGHVDNGLSFNFVGEGCWCISREDFFRLVDAVQEAIKTDPETRF